jgi:hypothetical protein
MLGFKMITVVDPLFTANQAHSLADLTRTIYAELETDADFNALGSVMPDAFDELWGRSFDRGHCFFYVPLDPFRWVWIKSTFRRFVTRPPWPRAASQENGRENPYLSLPVRLPLRD